MTTPHEGAGRTSFWVRAFDTARRQGTWTMVHRHYTMRTASQIASDIVNAAHRHPSTVRVRGIRPGERWDARWAPVEGGAPGDHVVWIRLAATGVSIDE